jgi:hypothetical protein
MGIAIGQRKLSSVDVSNHKKYFQKLEEYGGEEKSENLWTLVEITYEILTTHPN